MRSDLGNLPFLWDLFADDGDDGGDVEGTGVSSSEFDINESVAT